MIKTFLFLAATNTISAPAGLPGPADFGTLAKQVTNVLLAFAGALSVIFIIIGGIMYATSAGNDSQVQKAKSTITNAIIGLVISLLGFAIVNFLIGTVFKP